MSVVHFTTEVSGGAGEFVKNVHLAMIRSGMSSMLLTRERQSAERLVTVRPIRRISASLRARLLTVLGRLKVLDPSRVLFGIEPAPVTAREIQSVVGPAPSALVFYWISYFVSFETVLGLKRIYPDVPFVLVCLDEAFLTGACHYSSGCAGYQTGCAACPATTSQVLRSRISRNFRRRADVVRAVDPVVVYPTSRLADMGGTSGILKNARSRVLPLGAVTESERSEITRMRQGRVVRQKAVLLVRSSSDFRKGADLLVAALELLSRRMPDLRERLEVVSIGDDTLKSANIGAYISHTHHGYVDRAALLRRYADADAFLVTSREDAGPIMINECVALGVFVISTPVGVAWDLITSDAVGRVTRDASPQAIAEALEGLLAGFTGRDADTHTGDAARDSRLTFEGYVEAFRKVIDSERAVA